MPGSPPRAALYAWSVHPWLAQTKQKDFHDRAGVERAAPFEVEVGLEEHGRELVDAPGAEVGVLFAGLVTANGGTPAMRQASLRLRRAARRRPAWWIFSRLTLIAASRPTGCSPAASRLSRCSSASRPWPVVAASSVFQIVSTRPPPTSLVISARSILSGIAGINGQLFDFGRQKPRLRPDQLNQEPRTIGGELHAETVLCELRQPRDKLGFARGGRIDR